MGKNFKAGIFVVIALLILVYIVIRISQGSIFPGSTYTVYMEVESALGLAENTPVQIAGVNIGSVKEITLTNQNKARLELAINKKYRLTKNSRGIIKSTGILGDSIVDIKQMPPHDIFLKEGDTLTQSQTSGDLNEITNEASKIAKDVKAITSQLKKLVAGDDSPFSKSINNVEKITDSISKLALKNEKNIQAIIYSIQGLTKNLNALIAINKGHITRTFANIDNVTSKVAQGKGTIGKLFNDDTTVEKLNDSLDSLKDLLGSANRLQVDFGGHSEYLGGSGDFKNYMSLYLRPRPDKYFIFEVTSDPNPSFVTTIEETTVESNGVSNTFTTTKRSKKRDAFQFSAQFAKEFKNFTLRGGLIESSGGIGLDYDFGPAEIKFSAFDFASSAGQKPHLKLMGTVNLTKNIYLLAGLDDFINPNQDLDWFVGAGFRITDNDIKSLLGIFSATGLGK